MLRAYKYRLYPTQSQAVLINKTIGACRFVYNLALETKNYAYSSHRKNLSRYDLMYQVTDLKKEFKWLYETDSSALQQSIHNLGNAFESFFNGRSERPRFKSKHRGSQSFRNPHGKRTRIKNGKVYQPKFSDGIKLSEEIKFSGQIRNTTISRTPTGKYFISILIETGKENPKPKPVKEETALGIDLGLRHFLAISDGVKIENPRHLQKSLLKLKFLHRQSSKKIKGSNNRKKANLKVALRHERIANQRKDFLHKLSSKLISENQTLCFEDLNIGGMVKNHNLAQSINGASWRMFVEMCKYKAEWYGKNILQIPTFQPSTKICSKCGAVNHNLTLADREWICTCGAKHDRDVNAAINIKNYCVGVQRKKPAELPVLQGAMKREVILI